jgi:hypothetical protein
MIISLSYGFRVRKSGGMPGGWRCRETEVP